VRLPRVLGWYRHPAYGIQLSGRSADGVFIASLLRHKVVAYGAGRLAQMLVNDFEQFVIHRGGLFVPFS
jgi:hypothetical protein